MFLCVVEAGSIRTGSMTAGVALNTCRAAIGRLEYLYGTSLFVRSVSGIALTGDGRRLADVACQMRSLLPPTENAPLVKTPTASARP
jgi:DNA-binding transcriptional LysR family regulator